MPETTVISASSGTFETICAMHHDDRDSHRIQQRSTGHADNIKEATPVNDRSRRTENDENRFCDEIFNTQLEKVAQFQEQRVNTLKQRIDSAFDKLKELAAKGEISACRLCALETELEEITNEILELKKYSNINYTGFLKIVKKHDRKRGDRYKLRPMMQLSLAQRPFNSEQGYSPLLNKAQLEGSSDLFPPFDLETQGGMYHGERYTAHKFWVHPDNLLEVKTDILRHLPALIYSKKGSKELGGNDSPAITSLYLDNSEFELYSEKVNRQSEASSLCLRWYGQLSSRPEIFVEQKTVDAKGGSQELKFSIKAKYVKTFLDGDYNMDKAIQKMRRQSFTVEQREAFKMTVTAIQDFVQQKGLSPVLRANYFRSAFQKPADDRIRISIDSNVTFIREDTLDQARPSRDPHEWRRLDIDDREISYPFKEVNQSEVNRLPYALLEIKLKEDGHRKPPSWVEDLMSSHLVHPTPRFSKFVHGVASLFEDNVNNLPSPVAKSFLSERMSMDSMAQSLYMRASKLAHSEEAGEASSGQLEEQQRAYGTLSSVIPGFSQSKYSKAKRASQALPEGVVTPTEWIKNASELKVEPKVWLANERTFLKWQHICILQGGLAVGLYTAAGKDVIAKIMGIVYVLIAIFAGVWGYAMLRVRRVMILERSGKDLDNMVGPIIISISLMVALILNFIFQVSRASELARGTNKR
ncbi:VTC domain-containing protein [Thelonectria olida]|uniref:VTC domain-containing protein n=1 Tax=Thelonectria olida TaxID=1576542 RepID=A0A9P9AFY5_9HYPO|nr:VTC domain-containing protein [Thelonectria olida]